MCRVKEERRDAWQSLYEATSATVEAEATVASLRSVVEEVRKENQSLHEKIAEGRDDAANDRRKASDALLGDAR